jgi:hypothetical protein
VRGTNILGLIAPIVGPRALEFRLRGSDIEVLLSLGVVVQGEQMRGICDVAGRSSETGEDFALFAGSWTSLPIADETIPVRTSAGSDALRVLSRFLRVRSCGQPESRVGDVVAMTSRLRSRPR